MLFLRAAVDLLDAAIEGGRDGVPEVEECVLLEADIDEHRLEAVLDVLHAAFEDAVDDIAIALALDGILLEPPVLEEGDAALEAL